MSCVGEVLSVNISAEELAPNIYILRGHADGHGYGDDFRWACIAIISGRVATIKALVAGAGETTRENYIAITEWLSGMGVRDVAWERYKNGKAVSIKYHIK